MRFTLGATTIRREGKFHWRLISIRIALRLPARLWIVILTFTICLLALTIPIAFSQSSASPSDAFADYIDYLPGAYWVVGLERRFHCNVDVVSEVKYCFLSAPGSLFAGIGLTINEDQITRTTFSLYEKTIKVGDLAAVWGKPKVQIAGYLAYLDWQNPKIRAVTRTDDGRFDYFLPVSSIAFD